MRPDAGAVQKRHPELDPALLGEEQQPLPHAQMRPADEGLSSPPPWPEVSRNGTPLGAVLMSPKDGGEGAPQIPRWGLALGSARLDQRLQAHPVRVREHCSSSFQRRQNARHHKRFKLEHALVLQA